MFRTQKFGAIYPKPMEKSTNYMWLAYQLTKRNETKRNEEMRSNLSVTPWVVAAVAFFAESCPHHWCTQQTGRIGLAAIRHERRRSGRLSASGRGGGRRYRKRTICERRACQAATFLDQRSARLLSWWLTEFRAHRRSGVPPPPTTGGRWGGGGGEEGNEWFKRKTKKGWTDDDSLQMGQRGVYLGRPRIASLWGDQQWALKEAHLRFERRNFQKNYIMYFFLF